MTDTVPTVYGTEYTAVYQTVPSTLQDVSVWDAPLRMMFFSYTCAATDSVGTIVALCKLPPGQVRLILPLSRIYYNDLASGCTVDLGWAAYTDLSAGTTTAADPNGLDDGNADSAGAAGINPAGTVGTHETKLFDSQSGVVLTAQVNDAAIAISDVISGYFVYASN
jgi:hypothetical protein